MRLGAERAHKASALRVGNAFYNHRPAGLAQLVQHRLRRRDNYLHWPRGFAGLHCCSFCGRALHGPAGSPAGCASSSCSCCSHGFYSHRAAVHRRPGLLGFHCLTSCAERSACRFACSCGSSCPAWGKPKASAGGSPSPCPLLRRADDPPGSWLRRARWA